MKYLTEYSLFFRKKSTAYFCQAFFHSMVFFLQRPVKTRSSELAIQGDNQHTEQHRNKGILRFISADRRAPRSDTADNTGCEHTRHNQRE